MSRHKYHELRELLQRLKKHHNTITVVTVNAGTLKNVIVLKIKDEYVIFYDGTVPVNHTIEYKEIADIMY